MGRTWCRFVSWSHNQQPGEKRFFVFFILLSATNPQMSINFFGTRGVAWIEVLNVRSINNKNNNDQHVFSD